MTATGLENGEWPAKLNEPPERLPAKLPEHGDWAGMSRLYLQMVLYYNTYMPASVRALNLLRNETIRLAKGYEEVYFRTHGVEQQQKATDERIEALEEPSAESIPPPDRDTPPEGTPGFAVHKMPSYSEFGPEASPVMQELAREVVKLRQDSAVKDAEIRVRNDMIRENEARLRAEEKAAEDKQKADDKAAAEKREADLKASQERRAWFVAYLGAASAGGAAIIKFVEWLTHH